jgi:hypothetical protein
MSLEDFARKMACKAFHREIADARALGYPETAAFISAFRAIDEVYLSVFAPDRPIVLTRFRP